MSKGLELEKYQRCKVRARTCKHRALKHRNAVCFDETALPLILRTRFLSPSKIHASDPELPSTGTTSMIPPSTSISLISKIVLASSQSGTWPRCPTYFTTAKSSEKAIMGFCIQKFVRRLHTNLHDRQRCFAGSYSTSCCRPTGRRHSRFRHYFLNF